MTIPGGDDRFSGLAVNESERSDGPLRIYCARSGGLLCASAALDLQVQVDHIDVLFQFSGCRPSRAPRPCSSRRRGPCASRAPSRVRLQGALRPKRHALAVAADVRFLRLGKIIKVR